MDAQFLMELKVLYSMIFVVFSSIFLCDPIAVTAACTCLQLLMLELWLLLAEKVYKIEIL